MERVPIAIVGCGGMGGRHLLGLRELYDAGLGNVHLVAVCDLRRDNAEYLANNAEELLGHRLRSLRTWKPWSRLCQSYRG